MPTILVLEGYRFFFFSNELNEPPHVHVEKGDAYAKYWLDPLLLEYSEGFSRPQLRRLRELVDENKKYMSEKWNEYFGR